MLDDLRGTLERHTRSKIEGDRDDRELALVVDSQRHVGNLVAGDAAQRHHLAARRADEDFVERTGIFLEFRVGLEHDTVLILRPIHDRDLALTEGAVQGGVDRLGLNSQTPCGVAVDHHIGLQALKLLVTIDVGEFRGFFQPFDQTWRPGR